MLLSKQTTVKINDTQSNIIKHLGYAAYKLWNTCNYERHEYDSTSGKDYPNWYKQKSSHKNDIWFKTLPSQTSQEVCKILDKSWKSYFKLLKTKGIENPQPPKYKNKPMFITYMQNGIKKFDDTTIRLTLTKAFKQHMSEKYGIHDKYLIIKNKIFGDMNNIKQIKLYMPEDNVMKVIVVYEVADKPLLEDNGNYLSIDLGLHNLMTCYDSAGKSFIIGRLYLSVCRKYDKEIARVQSQWSLQQVKKGIKNPKPSKHVLELYKKKHNTITDLLHKYTHEIVSYCENNNINTIIIGDITGIREDNNCGDRINQQLHSLPYKQIYEMLQYKSSLSGIQFKMVKEYYSSQCSPTSESVCKENSKPKNRVKRGLYSYDNIVLNADCVGAFNIMRLYLQENNLKKDLCFNGLKSTTILKVAV